MNQGLVKDNIQSSLHGLYGQCIMVDNGRHGSRQSGRLAGNYLALFVVVTTRRYKVEIYLEGFVDVIYSRPAIVEISCTPLQDGTLQYAF